MEKNPAGNQGASARQTKKKNNISYALYDLEGHYLEHGITVNLTELARYIDQDPGSVKRAYENVVLSVGPFQIKKTDPNISVPKKIGDISELRNGQGGSKKTPIIAKRYKGRVVATYKTYAQAALKNSSNVGDIYKACQDPTMEVNNFTYQHI